MHRSSILLVDDEEYLRSFVADVLKRESLHVVEASNFSQARQVLDTESVDLLITDICMPGGSGLDLARLSAQNHPHIPVIIVTAYARQEYVRETIELNTVTFLTKPFTTSQILYSVYAGLEERKNRAAISPPKPGATPGADCWGIIGSSRYTQELRRSILMVASGDFPIIIEGPSGSGKELIAKAVHTNSPRAHRPIVAINCAAIPEQLQESEFFGHKKGAFTGAHADRQGIIAAAHQSTLFLDEVGELSLATQAKLLRVLDNKEYIPLGQNAPCKVDMRVVSATNRSLQEMVALGSFRGDLYYRLQGTTLHTKALCEHQDDIAELVHYFLSQQINPSYPRAITAEALAVLVKREWPGNVRELKHTINLLCHTAAGCRRINAAALHTVIKSCSTETLANASYKTEKSQVIQHFEQEYFSSLLRKYQGNLSRAAEAAQMHRPNLIKKLHSLAINPADFRC